LQLFVHNQHGDDRNVRDNGCRNISGQAVFTETTPGAANVLFLLPISLPALVIIRKKLIAGSARLMACLGLVFLIAAITIGCGGGSAATALDQTHQVTSSGVLTLTVQ
jgi:hypothetical protein